jgi:thiol-disulfide isomerase/thioredoxin
VSPETARPRRARPIFLLIGVVLALGLGIGLFTGVGTGTSNGRPAVGHPAPTFSLPRLGRAGTVGIPANGGAHGHPAVLLFYASWCPPCHAEMPALANEYRSQRRDGGKLARVSVVGVDGYDPTADALAFAKQAGITFPVGEDSKYDVTEGLYYLTGDPDAVFVYADGTIAKIVQGPVTVDQFRSGEEQLVNVRGS